MKDNTFRQFILLDPVSKALDIDPENTALGPITGIASTDAEDLDGDFVDQEGLDWSLFKGPGGSMKPIPLTYEHPYSVKNTVGEATAIEVVERDGRKATIIKGNLFLGNDQGREIWQQIVTWKKAGSELRLGFSVEGKVLSRDGNTIKKARIHSIAISQFPRNQESWLEPLAASIMAQLKSGEYELRKVNKAEAVGYPDQSAGEGGVDKLVNQKHKKTKVNSSWLSDEDASAVAVAKQFPELSWSKCCELAGKIRTLLSGSNKESK